MIKVPRDVIQKYRDHTFRLLPHLRLTNPGEAAEFVKERGFIYFWPIKGITLPSLWMAVAGERPVADAGSALIAVVGEVALDLARPPVADAHDDPGHVTWGWKDDALGKRIWYYGKILRKKATLVSLEVAPYFYALSENYGNPEEDVRIAYQEGRLILEAKAVFETLVDNGPMDTISIRRATRLTSKESNARFERALAQLQSDFKILPVGISRMPAPGTMLLSMIL